MEGRENFDDDIYHPPPYWQKKYLEYKGRCCTMYSVCALCSFEYSVISALLMRHTVTWLIQINQVLFMY